jgi:plasmid stabilization system protein ParE
MRYAYYLHPKADEDYITAYIWYEKQQEGLGEKFITAIRKKLEAIVSHPEIYSSKDKEDYREVLVNNFPYVIVYKVYKQKKEIFISSIHHTKKHPKKKYRK